jgi:hypothetical protein
MAMLSGHFIMRKYFAALFHARLVYFQTKEPRKRRSLTELKARTGNSFSSFRGCGATFFERILSLIL